MKKFIPVVLLAFIVLSFKDKQPLMLKEYSTPPGTIKIDNNFFIDQTEVSNFSYLEFLIWTKKHIGDTAYKAILPDTNVWTTSNNTTFQTKYLRSKDYRDFPVVGISQKQAEAFCKWRSDRVMEFFLIKKRLIKFNPNAKGNAVFTIEKYFNGQYNNTPANSTIQYYPEYSLPNNSTFIKVARLVDSIKTTHATQLSKYKLVLAINCLDNNTSTHSPHQVYEKYHDKYLQITDIIGNVREWTNKENVAFGGSYMDLCIDIEKNLFFNQQTASAYTGFRCTCTWKKWEKQ